ncbi:hypothetical protein CTAYLR_005192 [Chrysophaeum taylorii]|uniref:Plant heme peroxidase family profile domain-containing protein n=1 Tax=Chrysophaeum taylorii TaxID=2483200 RepID=A0AAD7UH35_9STRA|nr:hypothetical protein CTAYLR_005175 [Chrysophaeum taylorii]KAJ8614159.1 hypothetical protein CTAYLR_005192 [Chrysophaeum taylorii]
MWSLLLVAWAADAGRCPFSGQVRSDDYYSYSGDNSEYIASLANVSWAALKDEIKTFLKTSQDVWPADYGNYGPLFVRLAWHNAGSYRTSDGRGGVDGARQRFDPERSWDDNTNLDKARSLLYDVKRRWPEVSWGDLIVLTGNTAVESMGGPALGFCAGRVDDPNGDDSALLGPTEEQEVYAPCPTNGNCTVPLGSTTIGLIYLNPQGPMGEPDAVSSAGEVRDAFGRMAMNDSETVALIGGGHAFGKTHGACPAGAGPNPSEQPSDPWPGLCGTGKGVDAYTSGIEGPWTSRPTRWDNQYFQLLRDLEWTAYKGPGDAWQWEGGGPPAPSPDGNGTEPTMMMTSDVSLTADAAYVKLVEEFAADMGAFETAFTAAWYKLMTRDMGPITRCAKTDMLPPPQAFQYPLPPSTDAISNWTAVRVAIEDALNKTTLPVVARLAWSSASTYRRTDYLGGANGARVRFPPAKNWQANFGLDVAFRALQPVKDAFGDDLTWADLIVFAGGVALSMSSNGTFEVPPFCPGRSDATDGSGTEYLVPQLVGDANETALELKEIADRTGLTNRDYVALLGARHSLGFAVPPFRGQWTRDPYALDNAYFNTLLDTAWIRTVLDTGATQYVSPDGTLAMQTTDLNVKFDAELLAIAQDFAADNAEFLADLASAWTKLMNADRFDRPHCRL